MAASKGIAFRDMGADGTESAPPWRPASSAALAPARARQQQHQCQAGQSQRAGFGHVGTEAQLLRGDPLQRLRIRRADTQVARRDLGVLRVGFISSAAAHAFTSHLLRACRREHPDIELQLSEPNAAELIEGVANGALHCAFVSVPVAQPPGVAVEPLLSEPVVLARPIDHPLALAHGPRALLPLTALQGQRLIRVRRPGAPGLYARLLVLLGQRGVQVEVVAEVDRMMTNLNLVASGAGISVVPESMRGTHTASVAYRALVLRDRLEAPLTLVHRSDGEAGVSATFCALARSSAQALHRHASA